ncbi:hormone receptor 4-like [Lucilia sericata]|uniref:hormone receptor 4-like n=2 Tax=Lucilia sericata TaxID=13632 RepID=UPI0018A86C43|nr:hormone receptor 4-like isoform X2 [Lucilia sericata]XP_037827736.1 hormone receptor 4-like [Lucilia sericata]
MVMYELPRYELLMGSNRRLTATRVPNENHSPNEERSVVPRDLEVFYCVICTGYHGLKFCRRFRRMTPQKRRDIVERLGYCVNCLARSHSIRSCTSMEACLKCAQLHHTLLHPTRTVSPRPRTTTSSSRRSLDNSETHQQHRQHQQLRQHQQHRQHHRQNRQHQPHPHHHQHRHYQHRHHQHRHHQRQQHHHHRQQRHQLQQRHPTPQPPAPVASLATNTTPAPDQHILAEAIKSLANVLCYQSKKE